MQVFCIAEEDSEADELKTDVKKFLYDLRMEAEVIVVSMKAWKARQAEDESSGEKGRVYAVEAFSKSRRRIVQRDAKMVEKSKKGIIMQAETEQRVLDEQQVSILPIFPPLSNTLYLNSFCLVPFMHDKCPF